MIYLKETFIENLFYTTNDHKHDLKLAIKICLAFFFK